MFAQLLPKKTRHRHYWQYDPKAKLEQPHYCNYRNCSCWVMTCECGAKRERMEGTGRIWR